MHDHDDDAVSNIVAQTDSGGRHIGPIRSGCDVFVVEMDDFKLFSRPLSADEVQELA